MDTSSLFLNNRVLVETMVEIFDNIRKIYRFSNACGRYGTVNQLIPKCQINYSGTL
jgi:hypothetical protein